MAEDDAALPMTHVNVYSTRADSGSGFLFVLMNSRSRRSIRTRTRAIGHGELLKGKVVSRGIASSCLESQVRIIFSRDFIHCSITNGKVYISTRLLRRSRF